jgi:hypothetical protein
MWCGRHVREGYQCVCCYTWMHACMGRTLLLLTFPDSQDGYKATACIWARTCLKRADALLSMPDATWLILSNIEALLLIALPRDA